MLVFIVLLLGFWIGAKPGATVGVTLRTGVVSGNTLLNDAGMLLVVGDSALGSVSGENIFSRWFSADVLL